jgi:hypothetical protein
MKLCHAAALALAVWYLMSPPVMRIPRLGSRVNHVAHLKYWKVRGTYPSAIACGEARGAMAMSVGANPEKLPDEFIDLSPEVMSEVTESLICVSSDDADLN